MLFQMLSILLKQLPHILPQHPLLLHYLQLRQRILRRHLRPLQFPLHLLHHQQLNL
jgi:hypothetical protein